jgi:hypothetical protein
MNNIIEQLQVMIGKDIEFYGKIDDYEHYAEAGMRATITDITVQDSDLKDMVIKVGLSFVKFDEYNKKYESSNYYNKEGVPVWTAREAGFYGMADYLYAGNNVHDVLKLVDPALRQLFDLFSADKVSQPNITYVEWLEAIAVSAMPHLKG